ncbi:MAG: hypothetical protein M3442_00180 [Chloroflexota bacterium]|nr:hypothetical protein [Chloroflexota bacterium]
MLDRLRSATALLRRSSGPLLLALAGLLFAAPVGAGPPEAAARQSATIGQRVVTLGRIDGLVNAGTVRYVERLLKGAERGGAEAVIITLNAPAGYERATRRVAQHIEGAGLPVIVFIAPAGARAAGAGLFLALAADVTVMAPGTTIAGRPGGLAAGNEGASGHRAGGPDAAALARAMAQSRQRNAAWVEEAVRDGVALGASEALRLGVVEDVASDAEDVLTKLDGRRVVGPWGERTLATRGATAVSFPPLWWEQWIDLLVDPNVAYLLFVVGLYGAIMEMVAPGVTIPGVIGLTGLVLSLYAFSNLPVSWVGVAVTAVAAALLLAETQATSHGVLALAGVGTFIAGSILLFPPAPPSAFGAPATLNPWLVVLLAAGCAGLFGWLVKQGLATRGRVRMNAPPEVGEVGIAGPGALPTGVVSTGVGAQGTVHLAGQTWSAEWLPGTVRPGERVRVVCRRGLRLIVEPLPPNDEAPPGEG